MYKLAENLQVAKKIKKFEKTEDNFRDGPLKIVKANKGKRGGENKRHGEYGSLYGEQAGRID